MQWFFHLKETQILPYSREDLFLALNNELESADNPTLDGEAHVGHFKVFLKTKRADSFSILISGKSENTGSGSILYLQYRYHNTTLLYISFWTIFCLGLTTLFFMKHQVSYGATALAFGLTNYFFSFFNYQRKSQEAKLHFDQFLSNI